MPALRCPAWNLALWARKHTGCPWGFFLAFQKKFYGPQRRKLLFMGFMRLGVWCNFFRAWNGGFSGNLKGEGVILGGVFVVGSGKQVNSQCSSCGSVGVSRADFPCSGPPGLPFRTRKHEEGKGRQMSYYSQKQRDHIANTGLGTWRAE